MKFRYQLIFLGFIENAACTEIKDRFLGKLDELGIVKDAVEMIYAGDFTDKYKRNQPAFVFYLGHKDNPGRDAEILEKLKRNGTAIYPLYFHEDGFENEIPKVIGAMNGTLYTSDKLDAVVNCALESFRLLRKTRRVFISYKRSEATGVAQQLFEVLAANGFDPFLDSYSIRPAENFQKELLHRLTDCDVLIQLHSPGFRKSKWCREEIKAANRKQIGVVVVLWPGVKQQKDFSDLSTPVKLLATDFKGRLAKGLKQSKTKEITEIVESVRARNLAARQESICGEFMTEATKCGRTVVKECHYLLEKNNEGNDVRLFIPAIGVPHSYDCFESRSFRKFLKKDGLEIYLLYDSLCIRKKWIEHLDWLNDVLEVKTIKRKEFEAWMRAQ